MNIPLNINFQQILLHLLNFSLLTGGLYFLLYEPVKKFMEEREAQYREMDEQAHRLLQEAEQNRDICQEKLRTADEEIEQHKQKRQEETEVQIKKQLEQTREQAEKILSDAKANAERERNRILQEGQKDLEHFAVDAVERLLHQTDEELFDEFLNGSEQGDANV